MYINGASAISPIPVFDAQTSGIQLIAGEGNLYAAAEPVYSNLIDPKLIRRMSRIIRMGVATAMEALRQAGISNPDAIITGTAYGCLEDTGIFLKRLVENNEEMLTPTAFIQSTHNTVGAQVALLLKCHAYNTTYVQRAHSFERSLQDTRLWLSENPEAKVLVGAADELTDYSFALLERFGMFRHQAGGEGAVYFLVSSTTTEKTWAKIEKITALFDPTEQELEQAAASILDRVEGNVDLLLSGEEAMDYNADQYAKIYSIAGTTVPVINYKKYCGIYPTASAFACWLAAWWLKAGSIEAEGITAAAPRRILVYQADASGYHSFILLAHADL
jgi:hypothetical protein